jgi:hypothetical protein
MKTSEEVLFFIKYMNNGDMPLQQNVSYLGEQLRELLFSEFKIFFGEENVKTKWRATDESTDDFDGSYMYTPETDLIVKPFNISREITRDNKLINDALSKYLDFLKEINSFAQVPFQENLLNKNPRCFIAIEVGGSGSEKHLLGDMYNASVLGKVGFVVGANPTIVKTYQRLYDYTNFAYTVGKTNQSFGNLAVLDGSPLLSFLKSKYG